MLGVFQQLQDASHNARNGFVENASDDPPPAKRQRVKFFGLEREQAGTAIPIEIESPTRPTQPRPRPLNKRPKSDTAGRALEPVRRSARPSTAPQRPLLDPEEVILVYPSGQKGAVSITNGDISRFAVGAYLNDTLIEFGLKIWLQDLEKENPDLVKQIHVFSSFFYKKLNQKNTKEGYESVRKWTAKFDLFEKKYILVPINENLHWYLAIIYQPEHTLKPLPPTTPEGPAAAEAEEEVEDGQSWTYVFTLDSLGSPHYKVMNVLAQYLKFEAQDKKGIPMELSRQARGRTAFVPHQPNYCDCGIYLLHLAETFISDPLYYHDLIIKQKGNANSLDRRVQWNDDRTKVLRRKLTERLGELSKEWKDRDGQKELKKTQEEVVPESSDDEVDIVDTTPTAPGSPRLQDRQKSNRITIINDTGRLSKENDHMAGADKRHKADEAAAACMMSDDASDLYAYNLRNSLNDEKLAPKFEPTDKVNVDDTIKWPDASQDGSKEEYEEEQRQLGAIANPIMQKPYDGAPPGAKMRAELGGGLPLCASGGFVDTLFGKLFVRVDDEKLAHKYKVKFEGTVNGTVKWPDVSQDDSEKKLEAIANPFMQKPYGGAPPGAEGGIPGSELPLCAPEGQRTVVSYGTHCFR